MKLIYDAPIDGIPMGHSQSTCDGDLVKYKIYDVVLWYPDPNKSYTNGYRGYEVYSLIDDTGNKVYVDSSRFMLLSEYREQRIEEILA